MERTNPTTDLVTLIGMMATIAGILTCLFFLFTPATFGATEMNSMIGGSPDLHLSMRWIQPILGQAIVEDAVMRQRSIDPAGATKESVQWVMGRVIVELHRSRMVSSEPGHGKVEYRIMTIARHAAQQFQEGITADRQFTESPPNRNDLVF